AVGLRTTLCKGRAMRGLRHFATIGAGAEGNRHEGGNVQTILIANPKGGSGKTTLATNIAGWLAGKRQKVVLEDRDAQQSATQWLPRRPALFRARAPRARAARTET